MDLDLSGRRAVVTGASAGIGAATVRVLAAHGADVAFRARRRDLSSYVNGAAIDVDGGLAAYVY